jgi:hypothetical protein
VREHRKDQAELETSLERLGLKDTLIRVEHHVSHQSNAFYASGFERALVRRLRNLSHALNVELLRSGLSRSLLPPSLLQAALQGQLEPQPAPANLLRLQVPLAPDSGGDFDSVALLLRLSDLELDQPRLRSCRSRWQRHRQEIRRMAERTRRLRRQLQRLEAERLWHQDNPSPLPPPDPSPPCRAGWR